jgi:hypothetical protein
MATARIKSPSDVTGPVKHGSRYGAKLTSGGRASTIEVRIPLNSKTFKILASESGSTKTLMEKYGAAVARSRMGKSVRFIVRLSPGHKPKFRVLEGESRKRRSPLGMNTTAILTQRLPRRMNAGRRESLRSLRVMKC